MDTLELVTQVISTLAGSTPTLKETQDDQGYIIDIEVGGNVGRVIGREGRTIDAIRTLTKALGYKDSHKIKLMVNDGKESIEPDATTATPAEV